MEENKDDVKREPVFDLYNHLKCNIKSCCNSCEIHDSEFTTYCLQCKRSICDVCLEAFHSSHNSTLKSNIKMSKEDIENAFMQLDTQIKENTAFYQPEKIKEYLKSTLTKEIEELYEKVEYYKLLKIKEIDESFKNNSGEALTLLSYIKEGKAKLSEFYLEFKSFFKGQGVSDEDNFIFLLNYDLLNEALNAGKEYSQILDEIKNYFKTCSCMDTGQLKEVIELVEIKIQQQLKISELNEKVLDEVIEINPKISKPSTKNLINLSTKNLPNPSLQKASSSSNSVGPRSNKKKITSKQLKILPTFNEEDFLKKKKKEKNILRI